MNRFIRCYSSIALRNGPRQGSIFVVTVLVMVILVCFMAFALDIGHISNATAELQNAADAAARAGARGLYKGPDEARAAAVEYAARNSMASESVTISARDVEIGIWDAENALFTLTTDMSLANAVRVTCRGSLGLYFARTFGNVNKDLEVRAVAQMTPKICGGFVGIDEAYLGSLSNSYSSGVGSYSSQTPGNEGDICSNGSVRVANGRLKGDARPGDGQGVNVSGQGHISGEIEEHPPIKYPPIEPGDASFNNDNNLLDPEYVKNNASFDAVSISSNKSTSFPGGILYLSYLEVNGEFRITGPTKIYVTDRLAISGQGIVNDTFIPSNLKIYVLNELGKESKVSGNGDFYGVIYAPTADLKITGGGNFFGAAVAWDLEISTNGQGTGVHFDENLMPFHDKLVKPKLVQ